MSYYAVRAADLPAIQKLKKRIEACIAGASLATECEHRVICMPRFSPHYLNQLVISPGAQGTIRILISESIDHWASTMLVTCKTVRPPP